MDFLMAVGIILGIIILVILGKYNGLVRAKKHVEQERSSIDVYLTQRFDLIPNLVECVKAYTKHESEIFEKIAKIHFSHSSFPLLITLIILPPQPTLS